MTSLEKKVIWFWEDTTSPHMAGLLVSLAQQGCEVVYLAQQAISADRVQQGWTPPSLRGVRVVLVLSVRDVEQQVAIAPPGVIHICGGIRRNGLVGRAQVALANRGRRQWLIMETVDDHGWLGVLKRLEYRRLFWFWRSKLQGVLAMGVSTPEWIEARGMPSSRVFPFAYFLPRARSAMPIASTKHTRFRFIFVGQFIERKRLQILIAALTRLQAIDFEIAIVGSGELEQELRDMAEAALPGRFIWIGKLPLESVSCEISKADCLVLPSRHDGWGAVVSEALIVGTPAICSDRCGTAGVVRASGVGGVFRSGNEDELLTELQRVAIRGRVSTDERLALAKWALCLGSDAGAGYLLNLLSHVYDRSTLPAPPWVSANGVAQTGQQQ